MAGSQESNSFHDQIQAAQDRYDRLRLQLDTYPRTQNVTAVELAEELNVALVELHVAAEEMQHQHEHLMGARNSIEAERQRYRDLFEFAPDGYLVTDREGHIQEANQAASLLVGLPHSRLMGRLLVLFIPLQERKVFRAKLSQIQATLQPLRDLECHIQHANGTLIPCEITGTPLGDAQAVAGFRWSIRDVSERKRIAEMETASRIKDEFLAIVSHELRSPLNPILGWSTLLRNGRLNEGRTAHALEVIERNAKIQAQLIEDLLDVSRILRGKLSFVQAPVNLVTVVQAALETVQLAAVAKQIEIKWVVGQGEGDDGKDEAPAKEEDQEIPPSSLPSTPSYFVLGDGARLQQVMWNVLSNAIKFTPEEGQVEIRLEQVHNGAVMEWDSREGEEIESSPSPYYPYAQITVRDNGKGIDPNFLPHLFDYFRQENSATNRQFGGLGLGLAIVRKIVQMHGGTVWAESQGEGQGATFTIRLPLIRIENRSRSIFSGNKLRTEDVALSTPLEGLHILIVDDEADSRDFTAFVVEQAGATVITAASGAEAIALLMQSQIDVLLSDIGMPDIDGYMLMQQVRSLPPEQNGQVKAIALTAYAGDSNQRQALQAGFQKHMPKPVEPGVLVQTVIAALA